MPVFTSFVPMVSGQFVPLCQFRENRQSVIMQMPKGVSILAVDTSGPAVGSIAGNVPAGVWNSVDTGSGPGTFRLSRIEDGDLVKQAWYGWTNQPPPDVQPTPWQQFPIGGTPPNATFQITPNLQTVVLIVHCVSTGPASLTVRSDKLGSIPLGFQNVLSDGATDESRINAYWFMPGTSDSITVSMDVPGTCRAFVCFINTSLTGLGQFGAQGNGVTGPAGGAAITVTTFQNTFTVNQPAFVVTNSFGPAVSFTYSGNVKGPGLLKPGSAVTDAMVSPDATTWLSAMVVTAGTVAGAQMSATITYNAAQTNGYAILFNFLLPAPVFMTVIEAFDEPVNPPPQKMFTVELPKLSPEAMTAFHDLMERIKVGSQA